MFITFLFLWIFFFGVGVGILISAIYISTAGERLTRRIEKHPSFTTVKEKHHG